MTTAREIVRRRKSVANIRKVTKTMEMIATARFKKAHDRSVGTKPYTEKITQLSYRLSADGRSEGHPLTQVNEQSGRTVLLVLTGNRGLCGGFNSSIMRLACRQIEKLQQAGRQVDLRVSGKKGQQGFTYKGYTPAGRYTHFDEKTRYEAVEALANEFIELYTGRQIDAVQVVYTRFISSAWQHAELLSLLPLRELNEEGETEEPLPATDIGFYDFYPSAKELLEELIPMTVRTRLFQCFMDAIVSEQVARMSAMKAATDNAEQMIGALTRQYNRARQSQITGELLDIIGGAEALR